MKLTVMLSKLRDYQTSQRQRRLQREYNRESGDRIQLMEFGGSIFICHDGTPIVCVDYLNKSAIDVLSDSRKTWINYKLQQKTF